MFPQVNPHQLFLSKYMSGNALFLKSAENLKYISFEPLYFPQYFLTPYQFMAFQMYGMNPTQIMTTDQRQSLCDVKSELPSLKFESSYECVPKPLKVEEFQENSSQSGTTCSSSSFSLGQQSSQIDLKSELEKMIRFLLANMGKDNQALIEQTRNYYLQNSSLLEIYDKITMKYYSAKKCKEDIIRCILRKAFRKIRTSIMREEKVSSKKASLLLCKRYFQSNIEPTGKETEEELLESLMPYNKNSKNRTMNINFVLEIFSSESFCKAYQEFLPEMTNMMINENRKKEEKLVTFLYECIQKKCTGKLEILQRLPWTDVWIEDAKNLAIAIMPNKRLVYNSKKSKTC